LIWPVSTFSGWPASYAWPVRQRPVQVLIGSH
jgi:hypothetical protein